MRIFGLFNPVILAYVMMGLGIFLTAAFYRKRETEVRLKATEFAFAFAKLSNYVSPEPLKNELRWETSTGDEVRVFPAEEQPGGIRTLMNKVREEEAEKLYAEMVQSSTELDRMAGKNRTLRQQFADPVRELLEMTHTFLRICEERGGRYTKEELEQFRKFAFGQVALRMLLLKRISGLKAEEYRMLNTVYQKEMEEEEEKEWETRRSGKK